MAKIKDDFIKRSVDRGYDAKKIESLWMAIEEFASYSFNKSHSVAYGYISFWTAYMKLYYPEEFFTVKFSTENSDKKFINLLKDAKNFGINILPPDINKSDVDFAIDNKNQIRFGLGRIKGVGEDTAKHITSVKEKLGRKFENFQDFIKNTDNRKVNKKVLEALAKGGAFDSIIKNSNYKSKEEFVSKLLSTQDVSSIGQKTLFGIAKSQDTNTNKNTEIDILKLEKEVLGFYISNHPLDKYKWFLDKNKDIINIEDIDDIQMIDNQQEYTLAGVVSDLQIKKTKTGSYMAIFNLVDKTDIIEVVVFPDKYKSVENVIKEDEVIVVKGNLDIDIENENVKVSANDIYGINTFLGLYSNLIIKLDDKKSKKDNLEKLKKIVDKYIQLNKDDISRSQSLIIDIETKDYKAIIQTSTNIVLCKDLINDLNGFGVNFDLAS